MNDTTAESSWIREGATVAVIDGRYNTITFETIERLTATQIALTDGRKYRRRPVRAELRPGHRTPTRLADPEARAVVDAYARQQLRDFVSAASRVTEGCVAAIHGMGAAEVREELNRLAALLNDARKEVDRRAHL